MSRVEIIYYLNDMLIELTGLIDRLDGTYVNDAAVSVTLTDAVTGAQIGGETWPLSMSYVAASNGDYRAVLSSALTLAVDQSVRADIEVDAGAKGKARFQPLLAVRRRALS